MQRKPVSHPAAPAYPVRVPRSWALGLLALGSAAMASVTATGCAGKKAPHGHHACPGDMQEPAAQPATQSDPSAQPEPATIPEVEPVVEPERIGGEMPAVQPVHPPGEMPAVHPEPVLGDMPAVDGDMPAVDGDLVVPHEETESEQARDQVLPCDPDQVPIPGGMPAPVPEPAEPVEDEGGDD